MQRVVIAGAAGLVGQNLIPHLKTAGGYDLVAIDKNATNLNILRTLHPDVRAIEADMAKPGAWRREVEEADALVMLQAQIGGLDAARFHRNSVLSTQNALAAAKAGRRAYVVQISSSVVNSAARDLYTESKKAQEELTAASGLDHIVLRPTLMFGWFDRKHLGWLARFMARTPVFPIPDDGKFLRQPLYAGDFANIVASALNRRMTGSYNISGLQRIDYIDLIRTIKRVTKAKTSIVRIPYALFDALLRLYSVFDRDPPFTSAQLKALVTPDIFEEIDWPGLFGVRQTPLEQALRETFLDPRFSSIALEF